MLVGMNMGMGMGMRVHMRAHARIPVHMLRRGTCMRLPVYAYTRADAWVRILVCVVWYVDTLKHTYTYIYT